MDTLEILDGSFVDSELEEQQADMLYRLRSSADDELYVYLLFEHKSYPDRQIFLQLLRYITRIWKQEWRGGDARPLVPVLPIVLYHGETRWTLTHQLGDLLPPLAAMSSFTPDFEYVVADFSPYSDEEIRGNVWTRLCLGILQVAFHPQAAKLLPPLVKLTNQLKQQETGLEYIYTVLKYLSVGARYLDSEELFQTYLTHASDGGEEIMTIAEQWIEQGIERGIEQGRQAGMRQAILNILEMRFDVSEDAVIRLEQVTNEETLLELQRRALTVQSLDLFLASVG